MGTDQPPLVGGKLVEKPHPGCYPAIRFVVESCGQLAYAAESLDNSSARRYDRPSPQREVDAGSNIAAALPSSEASHSSSS